MLRNNLTLKEHLEQATYAYKSAAQSNLLTVWYKAAGVVRAEDYLLTNANATDEDILKDLRNSKGSLASSTDYKKRVALAVLAYRHQCSVDILVYAITKCAQDRQASQAQLVRVDHNCTLADLDALKRDLIAGCINGYKEDEVALARKVTSILKITALADSLNRSYRDVAGALMACVGKRRENDPHAEMSTLLEECEAGNKRALEELSMELNRDDRQVLEMQSVSSSPRP